MKLDSGIGGVIVIAPTPFHPDGRIDDGSIDRMTDFFIEKGMTGITVLGQLGEAPKLEHTESVSDGHAGHQAREGPAGRGGRLLARASPRCARSRRT